MSESEVEPELQAFADEWIDSSRPLALSPDVALGSCRKCGAALVFRVSDEDVEDNPLVVHVRWHGRQFFDPLASAFGGL